MAQSGTYTPGAVNDVKLDIYVNGILRQHEKASWSGDTPGGLPSQVVSTGTGMISRTGSITWAPPEGVMAEAPHPIRQESGWPPRKGDRVVIEATVNGVTFRRFTGRLGKTTGSIHAGTLTSEITDTLGDHLGAMVNIAPRLTGTLGQSYRIAWEALEQARLGLLPRPGDGPGTTALHLTPQGDSWATVGDTNIATATSTRDLSAGLSLWSGLTGYPDDSVSRGGNSILVIARGSTEHDSYVRMRLTDDTTFQMEHDLDGTLRMYVNESLVRTDAWEGEGVPILAFVVTFGFVYMYTSPTYYVATETNTYTAKALRTSGGNIAATHLRYLPSPDATTVVGLCPTQPAAMRLPTISYERLPTTRGFENVRAKSVVDAWGESVLASVWMDEFGQTEVCSRAVMLSRPVQRDVRLSERAFGGSWTQGEDDVYAGVVVAGEQGAIQGSPAGDYRVTIYQEQSARVVTDPETFERFIEAPPEVDWGPVDLEPSRWTSNASVTGNQPGIGTWIHAVVPYDGGGGKLDRWAWDNVPNPSTYDATFERLGQRTLKVTETVAPGVGIADGVFLKSPERKEYQPSTWIWSPYRDVPSPVIRARWATTWAGFARSAGGGPAYGPTLEHEVGWWLSPADAQKLANALAAEVTSPMATLGSTPLLWDPRRQVGDIEDWRAQDKNGDDSWVARVLITGYTETWERNVPTQSVDSRVVVLNDPVAGKTYEDLSEAYLTYSNISASMAEYGELYDSLPDAF